MTYKISVDTGGTFTDVVVSDENGQLNIGKAPTAENAFIGVRGGLEVVADQLGLNLEQLLGETTVFIYSTTRSTNAILEGKTAKTALLVTEGFPDILVLREGGKLHGFDLGQPYPKPYIPRSLTFEIPERIDSEGVIKRPLDEDATRTLLESLKAKQIDAIAVCLLWSVVNGVHEKRIGQLIEEVMPQLPYTLSHEINPIVREYRRASSTAIDASLKPMMSAHLLQVADDLANAGFDGELMFATSLGGVVYLDDMASKPIESVRSGPSMAPLSGKTYAEAELINRDLIICDTGGTSFDVSLVRDGTVSYTRETWLGPQFTGHLTGVSSVDIRSIGSGGGSIAWIDSGGLLRVGPESAHADPGPACYGRGGIKPTVTDAAVVLGYIDPAVFLGGRMKLDADAASYAVATLAQQLHLDTEASAAAILTVANEHMVGAIQDITVNEGVDPREALVVAGGGAAGLGVVPIVRELGCSDALIPRTAGAFSAIGAQFSDIVAEFSASCYTDTKSFDKATVGKAFKQLNDHVEKFAGRLKTHGITETEVNFFVDARYAYQVWQLEVSLPQEWRGSEEDVRILEERFDQAHLRVFAVSEPGARVECLTWKARLRAPIGRSSIDAVIASYAGGTSLDPRVIRPAYFDDSWLDTPIYTGDSLPVGTELLGPTIIEEPTCTIVVPPGSSVRVTKYGNYYLEVTRPSGQNHT